MDWQLTILLILVGLIIIGFIYFDAKRRTKVRRERVERKLYQDRLEKSRAKGFDDDGIGQVRVVGDDGIRADGAGNEDIEADDVGAWSTDHQKEYDEELALEESKRAEKLKEEALREDILQKEAAFEADKTKKESVITAQAEPEIQKQQIEESLTGDVGPIGDEHVEPTISENDIPVLDDALFEFTRESLKKEPEVEQPQQTSLFDDSDDNEPELEVEPELIFSLFVVAEQERPFQGAELIQTLVEQGMRHGDMDIFHRHAQANGRGAVQFSLANAFEPGIFDLKKVDDIETRGLALFMALPGPKKPMKAYELMIKTAQGITKELGGFVLDASKSTFSKQIESHHKEQIVEFERKQLLNK